MDVFLVGGYVLHFPRTLVPPYPSGGRREEGGGRKRGRGGSKLHVVNRLLYVLDTSDLHNTSILLVLMGAVTVISAHAERK